MSNIDTIRWSKVKSIENQKHSLNNNEKFFDNSYFHDKEDITIWNKIKEYDNLDKKNKNININNTVYNDTSNKLNYDDEINDNQSFSLSYSVLNYLNFLEKEIDEYNFSVDILLNYIHKAKDGDNIYLKNSQIIIYELNINKSLNLIGNYDTKLIIKNCININKGSLKLFNINIIYEGDGVLFNIVDNTIYIENCIIKNMKNNKYSICFNNLNYYKCSINIESSVIMGFNIIFNNKIKFNILKSHFENNDNIFQDIIDQDSIISQSIFFKNYKIFSFENKELSQVNTTVENNVFINNYYIFKYNFINKVKNITKNKINFNFNNNFFKENSILFELHNFYFDLNFEYNSINNTKLKDFNISESISIKINNNNFNKGGKWISIKNSIFEFNNNFIINYKKILNIKNFQNCQNHKYLEIMNNVINNIEFYCYKIKNNFNISINIYKNKISNVLIGVILNTINKDQYNININNNSFNSVKDSAIIIISNKSNLIDLNNNNYNDVKSQLNIINKNISLENIKINSNKEERIIEHETIDTKNINEKNNCLIF